MADYVAITQVGTELMLYAYEHPCEQVASLKAAAEDVLRAHSRQRSPRMSYNGTGYRFLCGTEAGFVVCCVCPTSLSQAAAEEFQRRVTEAFQEYVTATLGSCDAGVVSGVTKAHRFVGFDRELRSIRRSVVEEGDGSGTAARRVARKLEQVEGFMRQNLTDLLGRGAALEEVEHASSRLADASKNLRSKAKQARIWAQIGQYWPVAAAGSVVLLVIWFVFM